jgi:DNA polymerase-3 subunit delta'
VRRVTDGSSTVPVATWQAAPWARIAALRASERLPHALLLDGPPGWGKRFFARQVARQLLELPPAPVEAFAWGDEEADGALLSHPDARIVRRTAAREGARVRQQITVDQIRELGEFLVRTAGQGGARVVILELAEELNVNAANALLKRLEEPGPGTLLLLVTHEIGKVLPTIRSRCQRLSLPPGSRAAATHWLQGRLPPGVDVDRLLTLAGDAPLLALAQLEQGALELDAALAQVLGGADPMPLIHGESRLDTDAQRARATLLVELLYRRLAGLARARPGEGPQLHRLADRVLAARRLLQSSANPNPALVLEDLLLGARRVLRSEAASAS